MLVVRNIETGTFEDEPGPRTDESLDRSLTLRTSLQGFFRDGLKHFKPVTALVTYIIVSRHAISYADLQYPEF